MKLLQINQDKRCLNILILCVMVLLLSACQVELAEPTDKEAQLEANKAVVERFYQEIWNEGNYDIAGEIIAPDFVSRVTGNEGPDAITNVVRMWRAAFPDMEISFEIVAAEGDIVVTRLTNEQGPYAGGLPPFFGIPDSAIGMDVVKNGYDFARIKDGKYVEAWIQHDDIGWYSQFGFEVQPSE